MKTIIKTFLGTFPIAMLMVVLVGCADKANEIEVESPPTQVIGGYHFEGYENYKAEIIEDDEGCKFMVITNLEGQNVSERAVFDVEFLGGCEF